MDEKTNENSITDLIKIILNTKAAQIVTLQINDM